MTKTALITGVTGQDGSYLSEFLLAKGYEVHGIIRRSSVDYRERIAHLEGTPHFHLHYADMSDSMSLVKLVGKVQPDEIYNLAAQSHVQVSFDAPEFTADVDAVGVLRILEAVRTNHLEKTCKIYQASTSELYGKVEEVPQSETTPFHPYSPYAVAKLYGYWIIKEYREAYDMFCCSGILFNHESERRGETFVTRKITLAAARIAQGKQDCLYLGNLDSLRDWGYAKDYVECMWLILQHETPEDFVIATGRPIDGIIHFARQLDILHQGQYAISFNGAEVYELNPLRRICSCCITGAEVRRMARKAEELNINYHAFSTTRGLLAAKPNEWTDVEMTLNKIGCTMIDFATIFRLQRFCFFLFFRQHLLRSAFIFSLIGNSNACELKQIVLLQCRKETAESYLGRANNTYSYHLYFMAAIKLRAWMFI